MTEREKQLREIARIEADNHLSNFEYMSVIEAQDEHDIDLTEGEAEYVHHLILNSWSELPIHVKLEAYAS